MYGFERKKIVSDCDLLHDDTLILKKLWLFLQFFFNHKADKAYIAGMHRYVSFQDFNTQFMTFQAFICCSFCFVVVFCLFACFLVRFPFFSSMKHSAKIAAAVLDLFKQFQSVLVIEKVFCLFRLVKF